MEGATVKYRVWEKSIDAPTGSYEVDAVSSSSTVITNTSLKTNITAAKVWVGGKAVRPEEITLKLRRYFRDGETLTLDMNYEKVEILTKPVGNCLLYTSRCV